MAETLETSGGNTKSPSVQSKRPNQLISWFFTWNNYPDGAVETLETFFKTVCTKYVFEHEVGESGTPHLQGVIWLKEAMRWSEFGLPNTIHWQKTKDWKAAAKYCMKDFHARQDGMWSMGVAVKKPVTVITDLRPWQASADALLAHPDNRTVHWIYDHQGCNGKTQLLRYWALKRQGTLFCRGGRAEDLYNLIYNADKNGIEWDTFVWDLPRENEGMVSWAALECIKDGLICNTKYKAAPLIFNPPNCMIFSNYLPARSDALTHDRWKVWTIIDNELVEMPNWEPQEPEHGWVVGDKRKK